MFVVDIEDKKDVVENFSHFPSLRGLPVRKKIVISWLDNMMEALKYNNNSEGGMESRFGELIEHARHDKRITLRKLGQWVGLQPSVISEMEHGRRKPPKEEGIIIDLAKILGINEDTLLEAARFERRTKPAALAQRLQAINPNLAWGLNRIAENASDKELETVFSELLEKLKSRGPANDQGSDDSVHELGTSQQRS